MIHQYEIKFSVMYNGKKRDLQSVIIPASSLEKANEKLKSEVKRRFGECHVKINSSSICVSEDLRYEIHT
ncbi:hypothetical protein A9498_31335 (plasmid) [Bacillus thuringiensis serovar coreanensis]|nr:hypothetical protein A9498_31145 [Bacillus thuringiensis serovar coreanensis]ANN35892.1 hypothetical protein A9498_31335 [Bacillus thuringiensis serovar coreanensis]